MGDKFPSLPEPLIVSLAPDRMKTLKEPDVLALFDVFYTVTGVDPLETSKPLADVLKEFRRDLTG